MVAAQWGALRGWLQGISPAQRQQTSVLFGWSVDDVISHLARTLDAIAALRPAPAGTGAGTDPGAEAETVAAQDEPARPTLTVPQFLSGYSAGADDNAERTRAAAAASAADRLGELDAAWGQAQRTLAALGQYDPTVTVTGGTMRLTDFLQTRLIELVVHAGDLHRSLPEVAAPPLLPAAVERVEQTLRQGFEAKAGVLGADTELRRLPADEFILVATGRAEAPERIPAAVRGELPLW
nr:maleylpyruvate isomerase N-terminal domain-containing protein [Nakamurella aerolata]